MARPNASRALGPQPPQSTRMNTRSSLLGVALAALLAACTTLSEAPDGSPRVEAEVVTAVAPAVHETLVFQPVQGAEERFGEIVSPMSDLGMRFYAVSTETYEAMHERPDYLLTIELSDLAATLLEETTETEEGVVHTTTSLDSVACTVTASLQRRREHAPSMMIGSTQGRSELRPEGLFKGERPPVNMIPLRHQPATGEVLEIREDDFNDLVERAALRALKELERPVDREFELLSRPLG